jgi:hypothetical protein
MKSRALRVAGPALAAIALMVPSTAAAVELWWFDHEQYRWPVLSHKKDAAPRFVTLSITDSTGKKVIGPCAGESEKEVTLEGDLYNKVGGMGEGELKPRSGIEKECGTSGLGTECKVKKLEAKAPQGAWPVTLKSTKAVTIAKVNLTIEMNGKCEGLPIPNESTATGTLEGTFVDFVEIGKPATIEFSKSKLLVGATDVYVDGQLTFGTAFTALPEPEGGLIAQATPLTLHGAQLTPFVFARSGRSVECKKTTFSTTTAADALKGGDKTVTILPSFSECVATFGTAATVDMNGCGFLFHIVAEPLSGEERTFKALADVKCPAGQEIEVDVFTSKASHELGAPACRFKLGEAGNQSLHEIDFTNQAAGEGTADDWIEADLATIGIDSKRVVGSALLCGPENDEAGTLSGTTKLTGTTAKGEANGISVFPG